MSNPHTLAGFVLASAALVVAPGPSQALVLARTMEGGRRAGMLTVVGLNVATLVHALVAALGLSALLATSALAFSLMKLAGAGYLLYLGALACRAGAKTTSGPEPAALEIRSSFRRAFLTGLLNPKVAVFFLAFLPQFIAPTGGPVLVQFLVLGTALALMDVAYEAALVLVAARASRMLRAPSFTRWRARVTGGVLIGLGAKLALAERR